jgi:hypothetical protein
MEPTEAISACEGAMRNVIRLMMGDSWATSLTSAQRSQVQRSMENEHQRREGVIVSDDLLAFADTRHLTKVIGSNWETFAPVFENRVRTGVSFEALTSYRNAVQHGRRLVPFERDLLSGISGQIRNMITLHLNRVQEARRHYPVIESATDSLGNVGLEGDVYPWDEDNPLAEF